jgi:acid-sensing ion channel, other
MLYQKDFLTLPARFNPRYDYRRNFRNFRKSDVKINVITPSGKTVEPLPTDEQPRMLNKWFLNFCDNTSVHGMKFIGKSELHWAERAIWSIFVVFAIFSIVYISLQLSQKFSNSPLSTVVESTIFPVAEIAYPAITICNSNRFHKGRSEEAERKFLPNANNDTLEIFRILILSLNAIEFGAFDEFYEEVFNFTSSELDALNITEILDFIMLKCDEIYTGKCWWRNKYWECCDNFFYLARSEYGLCYSFNSAVHEIGKMKEVRNLF